jgi:iron complex transport system permease protein
MVTAVGKRLSIWITIGIVLLLLSIVVSVSMGAAQIPLLRVWRILIGAIPYLGDGIAVDWPTASEQIIMQVRLPRIVLGLLVGIALATAGAGFQGVLRNPLADPFTLGVASGAAVGAATLILLNVQYSLIGMWSIPLVAFTTGMGTLAIVYTLSRVNGAIRRETLILAGVIVQAFLAALVSFILSLADDTSNQIIFWLMGSLSMRGWQFSAVIAPFILLGVVVLCSYGRTLNIFELGERSAYHLGVRVESTKWVVLTIATLMAAAAVSVAGVIGFVGLVIPHLVRLMVGPDYRLILPLSALTGAIYVTWADTLARMLLAPTEIPLGVLTAFLGVPLFIYLLWKYKQSIGGADR